MPSKLFYKTKSKLVSIELSQTLSEYFARKPSIQNATYVGRNTVQVSGASHQIPASDGAQLKFGKNIGVENVGRPAAAIYVVSNQGGNLGTTVVTDEVISMADHTHLSAAQSGLLLAYIAMTTNFAGGANVMWRRLREWTEGEDYEVLSATYDSTYFELLSRATLKWPDGSAGTWRSMSYNTTWRSIDSYRAYHADSGLTVEQPLVTRDSRGNISTKPELAVIGAAP